LIRRVQTSAVLHEVIQYCNAVLGKARIVEGRIDDPIKHLKRKENASTVSSELLTAQKPTIPDETIKRNNINMLAYRFSVAPMMDWTDKP
jgi:hypothetical protein